MSDSTPPDSPTGPTPDGADVVDIDADESTVNSGDDPVWRAQQLREARKRAIIWGLVGGLIMSVLLVGSCVLLLLAAG